MRQHESERDLIGRMRAGDGRSRRRPGVDLRPTDPAACIPLCEELGRCRGSRAGRPDEGVPKDRRLPRGRGAVVLDLPHHVQHRDVAPADRARSRAADEQKARRQRDGRGVDRQPPEPADWSSLADDHVLRGEMRQRLIECADAPAGGLPGAGDSAGYPGVVDRRGERGPAGQAADAEVAPAPRPADPARTPRRFRGRRHAARARGRQLKAR